MAKSLAKWNALAAAILLGATLSWDRHRRAAAAPPPKCRRNSASRRRRTT